MRKGKVIVIEGACDGVGKTTQYDRLYEHLIKDKKTVIKHHFPTYNTPQGKPVEMYLNGEFGNIKDLSPYFINTLYAEDRAITWHSELKSEYNKGNVILCDRYTTSSLLYQACVIEDIEEKKKFLDYVSDFEYNKLGIKEPDCVIFLYASFDLVTKIRNERKGNDGIENDIHERDIEFMKKVYDNAMFVAEYLKWNMIKCDEDDHMRSIDDIHNDIYKAINKKTK